MPSVYKTPPFDGEILLEFDINTLQELKKLIFFRASRRNIREIYSRNITMLTVLKAASTKSSTLGILK